MRNLPWITALSLVREFLAIERAFWMRVAFKKPLMTHFIGAMCVLTIIIASMNFTVGTFWWWAVMLLGFYAYLIAMPMAMYLISPRTFFKK